MAFRKPFLITIACFTLIAAGSWRNASASEGKAPLPGAAAQRDSRIRLEEAFPSPSKKPASREEKLDRGRNLLASATSDIPTADRYVLLNTALSLGIETGDLDLVMGCLGALSREFAVDADADAARALELLAPKVDASQVPRLVEEIISLTAVPAADGKADDREGLLRVAVTAARRANARAHLEMATAALAATRQADRQLAKERQLEARLAEAPDDHATALELAMIKCLIREDWSDGLRFLQRAGDERVAALAKRDLESKAEPKAMLELADEWWDVSTECSGDLARAATSRAVSHYTATWDTLKGLDRPRVQRRLEEANARLARKTGGKAPPRPAALLLHVDAAEPTALIGADGRPVGARKDAPVARWIDTGSVGFSPVQAAAGSMPVAAVHPPSGQRAVRFRGKTCLVSHMPMPKDGVLFVVCQPDRPLVTGCPIGLEAGKSGIELCSRADGMALFRVFPSRGEREQINTDPDVLTKLGTVVITVSWTLPTSLRVNGVPLNVWMTSRRPDIGDSPGLVIGARTHTCDEAFQGLVCECLVFRGPMDDSAVTRIEKDLAIKWRIQARP